MPTPSPLSGGGTLGTLLVVYLLAGAAAVAVWLWALIDAIRMPSDADYRAGSKVFWVLVILFLPAFGGLLYFIIGKPRRG
jgi:hypothetical protein